MSKESQENQRERLRQKELKNNPTGNMHDSFNRANGGGLVDVVNSLGWKGMGVAVLIIIAGIVIVSFLGQ